MIKRLIALFRRLLARGWAHIEPTLDTAAVRAVLTFFALFAIPVGHLGSLSAWGSAAGAAAAAALVAGWSIIHGAAKTALDGDTPPTYTGGTS